MLRLHYVTQPLLQGRGPKGEGAHARATPPTVEPALGLCSETPRTRREGCAAAGAVRVRKLGAWDVPEEFPWEDFCFLGFPNEMKRRREKQNKHSLNVQ